MADENRSFEHLEQAHLRPSFFSTQATKWTRFLRVFLPWQLVRFAIINLKMMRVIALGHGKKR